MEKVYSSKVAGNKNRRKSNVDGGDIDDEDESMLDVYHQNIAADIDRLVREFSTLDDKGIQPEIPDTVFTFLRIIELRIKRYNSTKSGTRFGKMMMMTDDQEADPFFTDAIKRLSKLKMVLSHFPNTSALDRITNLLQQTMMLMQDEFQALLLDYAAPSEPLITICKKTNSCTSLETLDQSATENTNNTKKQQECCCFPGYSKENVILMQKMASFMILAGYQSECCQVYTTVRKDGLQDQLKRFGFEKVNVEDAHKSKWASLEPDISRWLYLANHCSNVLFPAERDLGETVFSDHPLVFTPLFINLINGITMLLVEFATSVAMSKPKAKRLFRFLDIYKGLVDLGTFVDESDNKHDVRIEESCRLKSEISSASDRMGEAVVNAFKDVTNYIRNDTNKTPVQGGSIHPLTRYVINYLRCAFNEEYKDTLEQILREQVNEEATTQLVSVIELLDANLETKSGLYKDPSLRCIFLMNNNRFILQVVKGSKEMKEAMGDNWCRRKSSDVRNYHKSYQRETWNRLLQCITQDGIQVNGKPNRKIVKEKLKSFNAMFDEIYKTQSTWVVNDQQLSSEIRVSITAVVSPAYRSFIGRYKPHFEGGPKSIDKYIKYQPEDIEAMMETLFEGTEKVETQMNGIQAASTVKHTAGAFKSLLKTYKNVVTDMNKSRLILHNAFIVTMDQQLRVFGNGGIVVENDRIIALGQSSDIIRQFAPDSNQIIDLQGLFILPGLINTHVHTSQQLARGIADDVDLLTWLHRRIWPYESSMTEEDSYISTLLCGIELIHSGVTCFAEAGGQHVSGMAKAVELLGLRACLTQSIMDSGDGLPLSWATRTTDECIQSQKELHKKHHNTADGRIRIWLGIRQIMNSTDRLLLATRDTAKELETGIHMHVAEIPFENDHVMQTRESDLGTVAYLEKINFLTSNLLAAHSVWVNEKEIGFLSSCEVKVSHCPAAAMRMLGFAPIKEMLDANICVSLGTDGAPSNNRMSIVDEMYLASLINKGREVFAKGTTDPRALPAESILKMATVNGAKAVLWEKDIGSLEVGKKADMIVINPSSWSMVPMHDCISSLVYCLRSENVVSVMCNGHWIMKDKKIMNVDEAEIISMAKHAATQVLKRAGIEIPNRMNLI
ncbi:hypothetical protein OSB04_018618 [Centaurea solstitialis]|uniref:Exocyst subunit Exo70 family protein n=1 Tax=Centaurea solstitialis TaxID=347529 RepID=A0AA38TQ32_9ASTR|nr:hypothetical protein OSB04_018618 [Centaurea solstitialis]